MGSIQKLTIQSAEYLQNILLTTLVLSLSKNIALQAINKLQQETFLKWNLTILLKNTRAG